MEKVKKSLVKKEYLVPFVLVTSLFFLWGFAHAILDVLALGIRPRTLGCAEQAFPGGACHDEGSFCFDPGNDVHGLFHNGYPSRTFY